MRKKLIVGLLSCFVLTAVFLTGCGSKKTKETSTSNTETVSEDENMEEETEQARKVGILYPDTLTEENEGEYKILKTSLEKKGYKVLVSFAEGDAQAQIAGIRDMMQEECEALVVHPADPYSLTEVLAEAKSQGITIISYEDLIMETADISYYVAFNARMTGQLVGNAIVKEKELEKARNNQTSCDIEFFMGSQDDIEALFFYNGILEILQPYLDDGTLVCRSGKLSFDEVGNLRRDARHVEKKFRSILQEFYPGEERIEIVCTGFDDAALRVQEVLQENGYEPGTENWPCITGMGSSVEAVRAIAQGTLMCTTFENRKNLAQTCADLVEICLEGEKPQVEETVQFDNGTKIINTMTCAAGLIDRDNYEMLIDNGHYTEEQIRPEVVISSTPVPEESEAGVAEASGEGKVQGEADTEEATGEAEEAEAAEATSESQEAEAEEATGESQEAEAEEATGESQEAEAEEATGEV